MDNTGDLRLLLASRHPLLVVDMRDERRFLDILRREAGNGLPLWIWSIATGLRRDGEGSQYDTTDPKKALAWLAQTPHPRGVFVFVDVHHALEDPVFVRTLKEFAHAPRPDQTVVLAGSGLSIPSDLDGLALPWRLQPPTTGELEELVRRTVEDLRARRFDVGIGADGVGTLVESLRGLSMTEAERLVQRAALRDGGLHDDDVEFVRRAKAELLETDGVIELVEADHGTLDDVGGMDRLKAWLLLRGRALEPAAREFGIDPPRGVLLTGVPGCGKSLVAKTLARTWRLPLVLLDPGRLYGPYVGQSEGRLRDALRTIEAMAPVVVWVDELEKAFASGGEGDGGVSRRILGTFLRWMQEHPPGVFLVATSNDVASLPPELLRKGRFDEIFFVDLPSAAEREEILRLHLTRRRRDPAAFDLRRLALATDGFSGADLEAVVVGALYRAFAAGGDITTETLLDEARATVPLSVTRAEDVARLRDWATRRAVAA
jgi:ATP-dependent 26S proteasome regulatory subunit